MIEHVRRGSLVRVASGDGRRTTLAYVSQAPKQIDGQWVVKLYERTGYVPVSRIKEVL